MILVHSSVQDLHLLQVSDTTNIYIFSEESASPPPTISPDDTGTHLSPGFTVATGV